MKLAKLEFEILETPNYDKCIIMTAYDQHGTTIIKHGASYVDDPNVGIARNLDFISRILHGKFVEPDGSQTDPGAARALGVQEKNHA